MDAWQLIRYNYPTLPADKALASQEVNWYLQEYVKCIELTDDQTNYKFSASAKDGYIWVPPLGVDMEPETVTVAKRNLAWLGVGGKVGGHLFFPGIDYLRAHMFSLDDPDDQFTFEVELERNGVGLGGGVGGVLVLVTGLSHPRYLNGYKMDDLDFDLDLSVPGRLLRLLKATGILGRVVIRNLGTINRWFTKSEGIKIAKELFGAAWNRAELNVSTIDIGLGVQISGYRMDGKVSVSNFRLNGALGATQP